MNKIIFWNPTVCIGFKVSATVDLPLPFKKKMKWSFSVFEIGDLRD